MARNSSSMNKFKMLSFFIFFLGLCGYSQNYTVSEFKIEGSKKIKNNFIEKIISIRSGGILDSLEIEKDIKILKRLPAIGNASYVVTYKKGYAYDVKYVIEENFTIIPSFNAFTSNDGEFAYRIGLSEFNFLGRDITIGGFYQKDIYDSYGVHFQAPYLFSKTAGLAMSFQNFTSQEPVFFDGGENTVDYKYNNRSFEVLGMYEFNDKHKLRAGVNYFTEGYVYKPNKDDVPPPLETQDFEVDKLLYKLIYEYDDLTYFYQYVSGFRSLFNFQFVTALGNDSVLTDFTIAWNDFLYYKRVGKRGNWASRLRVGLATNNDSPFAPFAVDNNLNVRGVGNTIDRGTGAIVLNTEYRHTLFEKKSFSLQGNAFIDSGSWRNPGGILNDFTNSDNIRVFSGVGVRFIHKKIFNAVFRIDYGFGLTENTQGLVFGIGQYF